MMSEASELMHDQALDSDLRTENAEHPRYAALIQLERQVERGSFFTRAALGSNAIRLNEIKSFTYGLIDARSVYSESPSL
jgi:hypothetical protein